jgi:MFS family permease
MATTPLRLAPHTRRLLLSRGLRSLSQGALATDFALYLSALGWSGTAIGLLLSAGGIVNALIALWIGPASDQLGRKRLLLIYQVVFSCSALIALLSAAPLAITVAAILGGLGRGANGAAGPFGPVEQAWLGEGIPPHQRARVYSWNSAIGFLGMGLGALLAASPAFLHGVLPGPLAYRPLFALSLLVGLLGFVLIWQIPGGQPQATARDASARLSQEERGLLLKLALANALNSTAIGLTGPLITYWFALRFHVGPGLIAPIQALTLLSTGAASLINGELASRFGIVRSLVASRSLGLLLLLVLPLMPSYPLAALVYILRSILNRGTIGARQAMTAGLVRESRRGTAFSISGASAQIPQALGPALSGHLLEEGLFSLPFYVAAILQGLYLFAYTRFFSAYEPGRES